MLAMAAGKTTERGPTRTCVGCGQPVSQGALVRLVLGPGGAIAVDSGGGTFGRGAYVHGVPACVARAVRGLPRAAKSSVSLDGAPVTESSLREAIATAYDRRFASLLATARRAKKVECGSDAVTAVCRAGRASLVVVATDAAQAADLTEVRRARQEGRVLPWGTKLALAAAISGQTDAAADVETSATDAARRLGVVAVTDTRIAHALKDAWLVATLTAADGERSSRSAVPTVADDSAPASNPGGSSGAVE